MRLLLAQGTPNRHSPIPRLAAEQVDVGPEQLDREIGGRVFSRRAPAGDYDLAALIERISFEQRPEVVAVAVDGGSTNWPRNVAGFDGPRLLLAGDAIAKPDGLARVLAYVRAEKFDRIVLIGSDADSEFIASATDAPLHWFPGLLSPVRDHVAALVRQERRDPFVACSPANPRRYSNLNLTLAELNRAGIAYGAWGADHSGRMEYLGHSEFAVIPSEHGEWGAELFEALAAGALVLASPSASAARLWPERAPFVACASPAEFAVRIAHFRAHPQEADAIRRAAAAWWDENLSEAKRREAFEAFAFRSEVGAKRPILESSQPVPDYSALERALPLVPALDALCARKAGPRITNNGTLPLETLAVTSRFPRLQWVASGPADFLVLDQLASEGGAACPQDASAGLGTLGTTRPNSEAVSRAELVWRDGTAIRNAAIAASDDRIAKARELLELGLHDEALALARRELDQPFNFADALVICADAALESAQWPAWNEFRSVLHKLDAHDPRLRHLETRFALKRGLHARRLLNAGWLACESADVDTALANADRLLGLPAKYPAAMLLRATALLRLGRDDEAVATTLEHLRHAPNVAPAWCDHGLLLWKLGRKDDAHDALRRAHDLDPRDANMAAAHTISNRETRIEFTRSPDRDLLITMPETSRRHGTGVLLRRFFPQSSDFVTLRSFTNYGGIEEFGSTNLLLSVPHLNDAELATRLKRTLEPWRIRRILCVPFAPADFKHAAIAHNFTGAPLCTYVMDDQNLVPSKVPDALAHALFEVSDLRLTISPEMHSGYAARYPFHFDLMPPIVVDESTRRENCWNPSIRPATHAALVGNVWSEGQLRQVANFVAQSGLKVDWFGREPLTNLAKAGLHGQGFLPEGELADRLTKYPFVLVPGGALDGTEDNEWLTRLSLPSRMVFLLQTQTPMLVLGSAETAAGSFVERLGVGRVLGYDARDARKAVREFARPGVRNKFLENARAHASAFVMPDAGQWIWRSLAAGRAQPAPFDGVFSSNHSESSNPVLAIAS
jgi:tetratricopeptide (TPR) repeat protein